MLFFFFFFKKEKVSCIYIFPPFFLIACCFFLQEEEYKRLSEALAEDGSYNAVGFTYSSDYYDPSEPTEEEEQPFKAKGKGNSVD